MVINSVLTVRATARADVFVLTLNITDRGENYECRYVSDPEDTHGINPLLREWLASNPHTILPHDEVI